METNFIDNLRNRKTNFPAPEEAIDKANACNLLSRDIYTDNTRFLYELLQNADDASCKSGALKFQIDFIEDYMIVSHEGKPFNEDDIESICSIGDGSKSADSEQTGFKGIGFKSVFAYSDLVIIKSGEYCFKFDKQESSDVWLDMWGNQEEWQQKRKLKNKSTKVNLPWQIIPINSLLPDCITSNIVNGFNVSTIIRCKKINELKESVKNLFSSAELILFLRSQKVEIIVNTDSPLHIVKQNIGEITSIARDGEIINEWLMHTTIPFEVPSGVREQIEEDKDHYPEKLREATKASISFAISIKEGKIEKLDSQLNNIYSFLPTSVSHYKFPFIVNSNFITDAGRQNLHQDYVWNQWLFEALPNHFLNWISQIAIDGKYGLDFLKVISLKSGTNDELGSAYNKSMKEAVSATKILPNHNLLLTVDEAILDQTTISSLVNSQFIVRHLNNEKEQYSTNNILSELYLPYASKLKELGVTIFDEEELKKMISSEWFIASQNANENSKLISFLSTAYCAPKDSDEILLWLHSTPFLLTQNGRMLCPTQVCFPNFTTNESPVVDVIDDSVYSALQEKETEWLRIVGVKDISDTSIIDTGKLFEEGYVTTENAIDVGLYIFHLYRNGKLNEEYFNQLCQLPILTQSGNLKSAAQLYLSNAYNPTFRMETCMQTDIFVSEQYLTYGIDLNELKTFLLKLKVSENIELKTRNFSSQECKTLFKWAETFWKENNTQPYVSRAGNLWNNPINNYRLCLFTMFEHITNFDFSSMFWEKAFAIPFVRHENDKGYAALQDRSNLTQNFFEWAIRNTHIIPTTQNRLDKAQNVYTNNIDDIAGAYLPVLNYNGILSPEWKTLLGIKDHLSINDYLCILKAISEETNKEKNKDNKSRISKIYKLLAEQVPYLHSSEIQIIKQWCLSNRILAQDDKFYSPAELTYTTLEGFSSKHQVYTGKIEDKEKLVELLSLIGVKIYTEENIEALFDIIHEDYKISTRLLSIVSILALLASEGKDQKYFDTKHQELQNKISQTTFYSCSYIQLAFRDSEARADRQTYAINGNFYFVGDISPAKIEPLLSPLCSYLGIKHKERELLVLMTEPSYDAIVDFLKEKEYNTDWLVSNESKSLVTTTDAEVGCALANGLAEDQKIAFSEEAKLLVLNHLQDKGFDISNVDKSQSTIHGLTKDGIEYPLVVKSCRNYERRLEITPPEWQQLFKPNSMLWLHFGGGVVAPIKAYELFTYQDKLTLSFDTVNIMMDERVGKIMQVMRYFNNVYLNLSTLTPDTRRADNLDEYSFHSNNLAKSDLGEDTSIKF